MDGYSTLQLSQAMNIDLPRYFNPPHLHAERHLPKQIPLRNHYLKVRSQDITHSRWQHLKSSKIKHARDHVFFWKISFFSSNEWSTKSCNTKHQKPRQKTCVYTKINKTLWGPRGVPNMSCCFPMIFISSLGICWKKSNQDLELLGKLWSWLNILHLTPKPRNLWKVLTNTLIHPSSQKSEVGVCVWVASWMIPSGSVSPNFCQPVLGVARVMGGSCCQEPSDIFDIAWQTPKQRSYKEAALDSG